MGDTDCLWNAFIGALKSWIINFGTNKRLSLSTTPIQADKHNPRSGMGNFDERWFWETHIPQVPS